MFYMYIMFTNWECGTICSMLYRDNMKYQKGITSTISLWIFAFDYVYEHVFGYYFSQFLITVLKELFVIDHEVKITSSYLGGF